ncbi:hypothetical protein BRD17_01590 [Halobacteriales archaeon SW_7_68_16]|nr:MAG: hypothetical protein BRD17_01590 [Halobacteriales archaeon SW_7_68_16]
MGPPSSRSSPSGPFSVSSGDESPIRGDGADVPRSGPAGPGRPDEDDTGVRMYGTETGEPSPRIGDSSPDETENGPDGDDRDEGEPEPPGGIASALSERRVRVVAALAGVVLGIALARRLGDGDETEDGD